MNLCTHCGSQGCFWCDGTEEEEMPDNLREIHPDDLSTELAKDWRTYADWCRVKHPELAAAASVLAMRRHDAAEAFVHRSDYGPICFVSGGIFWGYGRVTGTRETWAAQVPALLASFDEIAARTEPEMFPPFNALPLSLTPDGWDTIDF